MMIKKHVLILGAGITGLSLAWFLQKKYGKEIKVTVLEAGNRAGGWIRTIHKDGFLFELGPHSCRIRGNSAEALELLEDLGLKNDILPAAPAAKKRYLLFNKKLEKVPQTILSGIFSPLTRGIPRAILHDLFTPKGTNVDESIYAFFARRFSPDIAERLIDPLVSGIYAGDIHRLSIQSCFPSLYEWEQQYGSVTKGFFKKTRAETPAQNNLVNQIGSSGIFSFRNGMESLPQALMERLGSQILFSCEAQELRFHAKGIDVTVANGQKLRADHLFSTLPAWALTPLISPHHPGLAKQLASIEYASLVTISLGYHSPVLKEQGFGYLIPGKEKEKILGMVWDSSAFPQQNQNPEETRITVMLGGSKNPETYALSNQECLTLARDALSKHLNIQEEPTAIHIERARQAIPQYIVGHTQKVASINKLAGELSPRLTLLGSAFGGISLCERIAEAKKHAN